MKNLYSIVSNNSYVTLIFLAKNSICYTLFDPSRLFILAIHKISHIFCVYLHWNCPNYLILTISNLRLTFARFCGYPFILDFPTYIRVVSILQKSWYLKCQVMGSSILLTGMFMQIFKPLAPKLRSRWIAKFY